MAQGKEFGFGDGRNGTNRLKYGSGNVSIQAHKRGSIGTAAGFAATKSERCNVHAVLSKRGADLADDAGLIAISQIENCAFELGLKWNAFYLQDAGRTIMQHGAFGGKSVRARFFGKR